MLETVLVAIDFSEQSENAFAQALAIAETAGSKLVLLWVEAESGMAANNAAIYGSSTKEVEQLISELHRESAVQLEALADRARSSGLTAEARIEAGHPDEVIVGVAERLGADLIVTGTKGLTGVKRFFLGSVAEKVARSSSTSVLVARGSVRPLQRILVPTDFSAASQPALELAAELGKRIGGIAIDLLNAWQYPSGTQGAMSPNPKEGPLAAMRNEIIAAGEAHARKLIARYEADGVAIGFVQEHGAAAAVIADRLEARLDSEPYDLVVMGTHGYRGFRRFLLGSVAEATVRHAPCSVLVVQAGQAKEA